MARKKHLINVHTSTATTAPSGASLYLGEIAVQHTSGSPALWIKVGSAETSTDYEKFIGLTEITNIFNESKILGSGYTYSGLSYINSATSIADAYSALTKELFNDEKVTAAALNDLSSRVNELPSTTDLTELSASVVTNVVSIEYLSGYVESNELITAVALNDLNDRMLTGVSVNGVSAQVTSNVAELDIPTPEMILGSGYTYSGLPYVNSATSIADAYSALTMEIINDEHVISAALNNLDGRLGLVSGDVADIYEIIDYISGTTLNDLQDRIEVLESDSGLTSLSAVVVSDEFVTSVALNDLNARIVSLSGNVSNIDIVGLSASVVTNVETIEYLSGRVQNDELVTAAALNDLNSRMLTGVSVNGVSAQVTSNVAELDMPTPEMILGSGYTYSGLSYINSATSIADAYSALTKEIIEDEEAISAELNDLNDRTEMLSGEVETVCEKISIISANTCGVLTFNVNGTVKGKYAPSADTSINIDIDYEITGDEVLLTNYYLASGSTEEELVIRSTDTVNQAFGKLQKQNYDNETVVAGALKNLNDRVSEIEAGYIQIPAFTSSDEGKVLMISGGTLTWVTPQW